MIIIWPVTSLGLAILPCFNTNTQTQYLFSAKDSFFLFTLWLLCLCMSATSLYKWGKCRWVEQIWSTLQCHLCSPIKCADNEFCGANINFFIWTQHYKYLEQGMQILSILRWSQMQLDLMCWQKSSTYPTEVKWAMHYIDLTKWMHHKNIRWSAQHSGTMSGVWWTSSESCASSVTPGLAVMVHVASNTVHFQKVPGVAVSICLTVSQQTAVSDSPVYTLCYVKPLFNCPTILNSM